MRKAKVERIIDVGNSCYYSLYYIPVFSLVKSLQIIMRISAQTK